MEASDSKDLFPRHVRWFAPWTWNRPLLWAFVILAILYPFGVGPAYYMEVHGWIDPDVVTVAYYPMWWAAEHNPIAAGILGTYLLVFDQSGQELNGCL